MHYVGKLSRFADLSSTRASAMWILECAQIRINWFDTCVERMAEAEFETDSSVRGYHVYQDNWTPVIGERLNCEREEENSRDRYAVAICNAMSSSRYNDKIF